MNSDSLFDIAFFGLIGPSQLFIEIFEIVFVDHLPNRNQKLLQLLIIQNGIFVAVEKCKILLVFLLFLYGDVFLYFLFRIIFIFVDGSELGYLPVSWNLREIIHESDFLSERNRLFGSSH